MLNTSLEERRTLTEEMLDERFLAREYAVT
jgi:hypothetical protein